MRSTIYPLLLYICKNIKLFGMKQIRLFGSFIIALLALSCGSDDDSIENSLANGKHITVVERIYNNTRRETPAGGNDFWESGCVHPSMILEDLVSIFSGRDTLFHYYVKVD